MLTKAKRLIGWRKNSNKVKGPEREYVIRERKFEKIQSSDNVIIHVYCIFIFIFFPSLIISIFYFIYKTVFLRCIIQRWQHMLHNGSQWKHTRKTSRGDNDEYIHIIRTQTYTPCAAAQLWQIAILGLFVTVCRDLSPRTYTHTHTLVKHNRKIY